MRAKVVNTHVSAHVDHGVAVLAVRFEKLTVNVNDVLAACTLAQVINVLCGHKHFTDELLFQLGDGPVSRIRFRVAAKQVASSLIVKTLHFTMPEIRARAIDGSVALDLEDTAGSLAHLDFDETLCGIVDLDPPRWRFRALSDRQMR